MKRCAACDKPIEPEDLVEEENPADPLEPFYYHFYCHPEAKALGVEAP